MKKPDPDNVEQTREKRIMNTIVNTSIILMSTLMGGFSELMVNLTGEMTSGMAEAFVGEKAGKEVKTEFKRELPKVNEKMKTMISDMRKDIYAQMEQKQQEIKPFLTDPAFDVGPQKIEAYNFGIPKLTEELNDETLAQYTALLVSEDATFAKLFSELTEWMNNLPMPKKALNS